MKILILADLHANFDALSAINERYDELWVLGDIVNYGPQPRETLEAVMSRATVVVQGNHDHAVGHEDDSRWSKKFKAVATEARQFTSSRLTDTHKAWLRDLPTHMRVERQGIQFYLTHATPSDPHYGRIATRSDEWITELAGTHADTLLVGHSHVPFIRKVGDKIIANPGSVGQPRCKDVRAGYAIWDDSVITLRNVPYPTETTVEKLKALRFSKPVEDYLVNTLRTGDPSAAPARGQP